MKRLLLAGACSLALCCSVLAQGVPNVGGAGVPNGGGSGSGVTSVTGSAPITSSGGATPAIGVTAASKADEQGGASGNVTTPAQQQQHDSAAKVSASLNLTTTPLASYNVTSVTHTASSGIFVINFTTPFATTAYTCEATPTGGATLVLTFIATKAVGSVTIFTLNTSAAGTDPSIGIDVACFGRQ